MEDKDISMGCIATICLILVVAYAIKFLWNECAQFFFGDVSQMSYWFATKVSFGIYAVSRLTK